MPSSLVSIRSLSHTALAEATAQIPLRELVAECNSSHKIADITYQNLVRLTQNEFGIAYFVSAREFDGYAADSEIPIPPFMERLATAGVQRVVTGGGPFSMELASKWGKDHGMHCVEIPIPIPSEHENKSGEFEPDEVLCSHGLDMRVSFMDSTSDVIVAGLPGIGTVYEVLRILQRVQMQKDHGSIPVNGRADCHKVPYLKRMYNGLDLLTPIILVGQEWKMLVPFFDRLVERRTINAEDPGLMTFVDTLDQAADHIIPHMDEWNRCREALQEES